MIWGILFVVVVIGGFLIIFFSSKGKVRPEQLRTEGELEEKERVKRLIHAAKLYAISFTTPSNNPLFDTCPQLLRLLDDERTRHWDFYLTVAGAGVAFIALEDTHEQPDGERMSALIKQSLDDWHPRGYSALVDFVDFVLRQPVIENDNKRDVTLQYAIGNWVLWNIQNEMPSQEQMSISYVIGGSLIKTFGNWWQTASDAEN